MTKDVPWSVSVRNNPYAGPEELKLKRALDARLYEIEDAKQAWSGGGSDLGELAKTLRVQRETLKGYSSAAGDAAVETYTRIIGIVEERKTVMETVAEAVTEAYSAVDHAKDDYTALPPVSDPFSGDRTGGFTGHSKKAIHGRKDALEAADQVDTDHANSMNLAETKAREARTRLQASMEQATAKIRPIADLDKPASEVNPHTTQDYSSPGRPAPSNPGVIREPQQNQSPNASPVAVNTGNQTPVNHPTVSEVGQNPPTTHHTPIGPTTDYSDGVLQSAPTTTPTSNVPTTPTGPGTTSPTSASPVVAPTSSTAALGRTPTAIPGTTQARSAALGRSSSATPARGALGRSTMMPGQSAAGRTGTSTSRGGRGMMPGQSGSKGTRGTAGSRGARGAGGRGMVPGTGGGRGGGKGRDRKDSSVDLLWDDGQEWLGDDETSPEVLG